MQIFLLKKMAAIILKNYNLFYMNELQNMMNPISNDYPITTLMCGYQRITILLVKETLGY